MSTTTDIVTQALPASLKNRPIAASDHTEYRLLLGRLLRKYVALGAKANPDYFGVLTQVVGAAGVWTRPANTESVYRIEDATKEEVIVVPVEDRIANYGKPRLYRLGRTYRTVGEAGDPGATDTLDFYCIMAAAVPASMDAALDAMWPTAYDPLLVADVALYLAVKDGRQEEVAGLTHERDGWLAQYLEHLEHETANEERRFHPRPILALGAQPVPGAKVAS